MDYEIEGQGHVRKGYGFFVLPRFQIRIIGLAFFSSLGTFAITSWAFYYLVDRQFQRVLSLAVMSPDAKTEVVTNMQLSQTYLVVLCVFFAVIMIGISIQLARRIAGPIYQLNKVLEAFYNGEESSRVYLRKNDEFMYLGDRINNLLDEVIALRKKKTKVS